MKIKDKKLNLLRELYKHKFNGTYYDVLELLLRFEPSNRDEAFNLAKTLSDEGLIKWIGTKDGASAEISSYGVEFIEEQGLDNENYEPVDRFQNEEKEIIIQRLDEFATRLTKIEVGQQITYDDLMDELETLKKLLNVLGKNDWRQILKGKLIDAGYGQIVNQVSDLIISIFKDDKLLIG